VNPRPPIERPVIRYALRREAEGYPVQWWAVQSRRAYPSGWEGESFFIYRDDEVFALTHEATGLCVATGPTRGYAIQVLNVITDKYGGETILRNLRLDFLKLGVGPKPGDTREQPTNYEI
jgi:hypothetical protein